MANRFNRGRGRGREENPGVGQGPDITVPAADLVPRPRNLFRREDLVALSGYLAGDEDWFMVGRLDPNDGVNYAQVADQWLEDREVLIVTGHGPETVTVKALDTTSGIGLLNFHMTELRVASHEEATPPPPLRVGHLVTIGNQAAWITNVDDYGEGFFTAIVIGAEEPVRLRVEEHQVKIKGVFTEEGEVFRAGEDTAQWGAGAILRCISRGRPWLTLRKEYRVARVSGLGTVVITNDRGLLAEVPVTYFEAVI